MVPFTRRHPFWTYLRVGRLLHVITVLEIGLIAAVTVTLDLGTWLAAGQLGWKILLLYPLWSMPIWAQLDARSRYQNYLRVQDQLHTYGNQERILRPVLTSRCQRDAALAAAADLGFGVWCTAYFRDAGYRWYHVLPDVTWKRPWYLVHPDFLRTTFFVPSYRPRRVSLP